MAAILDFGLLRSLAATLIAGFSDSVPCTFHRHVAASYDPLADVEFGGGDDPHIVPAVVLPRGATDENTPYNDRVQVEQIKLICQGPFEPQPGDTVDGIPGKTGAFAVTDVKPIDAPDGTGNLLYVVLAEKGPE